MEATPAGAWEKTCMEKLTRAFALFCLFSSSCSMDVPDDSVEEVPDAAKADAASPVGSWVGTNAEVSLLDLQGDGSFVATLSGAHDAGRYRLTHSGSIHYVRLYDASGALLERYAWKLGGGGLLLRLVGTSPWLQLSPTSVSTTPPVTTPPVSTPPVSTLGPNGEIPDGPVSLSAHAKLSLLVTYVDNASITNCPP